MKPTQLCGKVFVLSCLALLVIRGHAAQTAGVQHEQKPGAGPKPSSIAVVAATPPPAQQPAHHVPATVQPKSVSASSEAAGHSAAKALAADSAAYWLSASPARGQWLAVDFGSPYRLSFYTFSGAADPAVGQFTPSAWDLEGTNNGAHPGRYWQRCFVGVTVHDSYGQCRYWQRCFFVGVAIHYCNGQCVLHIITGCA